MRVPTTSGPTVLCALAAFALAGCGERDPYNAYDVAAAHQFHAQQREEAMARSAPDSDSFTVSSSSNVRCRCDADGGLHVTAPATAQVRPMTNGDREDAEAEIAIADRPAGTRIRRTVSLGYVGDGPLTQVPSRGGPWNVPDALLPPHQHVEPRYPSVFTYGAPFYGYRGGYVGSYGYGGYGGHAGGSRGGAAPSQPQPAGGLHYPTHIHQGAAGGSHAGSGTVSSGGGRGPR